MTATAGSAGQPAAAELGPPPPRKRSWRKVVNKILWYASAVVLALFIAFPLYLIFIAAISTREEIFSLPKSIIPSGVTFDNIEFFINSGGGIDAFWRSVIVGIITVLMALAIGAPAGYAIARYVFRGRSG